MHDSARTFVAQTLGKFPQRTSIVEFGSRDVNGSIRHLFPNATYIGVDQSPGPGVDVVCEASRYNPSSLVDTVICMETLEHTPNVKDVVDNAYRILVPGGLFIVTTATIGRPPHSAVDGGHLRAEEYYGNISREELESFMRMFQKVFITTARTGLHASSEDDDIYAWGIK